MADRTEHAAFLRRLDRHGPALGSWPSEERAATEALVARNAEARLALSHAERAAELVRIAMAVPPPPFLAARIIAHTAARRATPRWWGWVDALLPRNPVGVGAALAVLLIACGVFIGVADDGEFDDEDGGAIVAMLTPSDMPADDEN